MVVQFGSLLSQSTVIQPALVFFIAIVFLEEEKTIQGVAHYLKTFIFYVVINCSITCYIVIYGVICTGITTEDFVHENAMKKYNDVQPVKTLLFTGCDIFFIGFSNVQ